MEPTIDKKSNGALVGAIIVVLILVLGGLYLWQANSLKDKDSQTIDTDNTVSNQPNQEVETLDIETELDLLEQENMSGDVDVTEGINTVQ